MGQLERRQAELAAALGRRGFEGGDREEEEEEEDAGRAGAGVRGR